MTAEDDDDRRAGAGEPIPMPPPSTRRLEAVSDGVFAVAYRL
jgi:hypothetical protein